MSDIKKQNSESTRFIFLITIVATLGGFLFGYDSGVINGTVDGLQKLLIQQVLVLDCLYHQCF
jgi:hypothetical protein